MKYRIDVLEIVMATNFVQPLLETLKAKGAPIEGSFWLDMKEGFTCARTENPDGSITFEFKEKANP